MLQHICFTYGFHLNLAKRLVGDLTPEQMCGQPHGVVNHPAWSLGHLAGASVGALKALGHEASLPAGWGDTFKTGGIPSGEPSAYPSKDELLSTLESLHDRVAAAVKAADSATLAGGTPSAGGHAQVFSDGRRPCRVLDDLARDGSPGATGRVAAGDGIGTGTA